MTRIEFFRCIAPLLFICIVPITRLIDLWFSNKYVNNTPTIYFDVEVSNIKFIDHVLSEEEIRQFYHEAGL